MATENSKSTNLLSGLCRQQGAHGAFRLWALLHNGGVGGCDFRKARMVCGYLLSFYCPTKRLAVELVDHTADPMLTRDLGLRDAQLASRGIVLLQFHEEDVLRDIEAVGFLIGVVAQSLPDYPDPAGLTDMLAAYRPLAS